MRKNDGITRMVDGMRLFSDRVQDIEYGPSSMPVFEFLSRCKRVKCKAIREMLEAWYRNYPENDRGELKARISKGDPGFYSATWELLMHELLLQLGYCIDLHPTLHGTAKCPDFLVHGAVGEEAIIEATVIERDTGTDAAARKNKQTVLDAINALQNRQFWIWVSDEGAPSVTPSSRLVCRKISRWLEGLDYTKNRTLADEKKFDELPETEFELHGWKLKVKAIPKSRSSVEKPSSGLIGAQFSGVHMVDSSTPLRDAIRKKATRYGDPDLPFVIAVNVMGGKLDEIDIADALFGQEAVLYSFEDDRFDHRLIRKPNGAWTMETGARNTRVSAVLIGKNVSVSGIDQASVTLYHNPWAKRPYRGPLARLHHYIMHKDSYIEVKGSTIGSILSVGKIEE